jgi:hypothetical protein
LIDLSGMVNDADFAAAFTISRTTGQFVSGGYQPSVATVPGYGIIRPADAASLDMIPDGDRVTGAIAILSTTQLYETNATGTSDTLTWDGAGYRIMRVFDCSSTGYWKAIAVRQNGQ